MADWNGDGRDDLVVGLRLSAQHGGVSIALRQEDGTLGELASAFSSGNIASAVGYSVYARPAVADWDGDLDLLVGTGGTRRREGRAPVREHRLRERPSARRARDRRLPPHARPGRRAVLRAHGRGHERRQTARPRDRRRADRRLPAVRPPRVHQHRHRHRPGVRLLHDAEGARPDQQPSRTSPTGTATATSTCCAGSTPASSPTR
ncbi:FG-GAP repeat domain-containing protein [Georgenia sp. AZ-5]|uniref:FG-GAP repeat domain-containing protein n=1 Tax=Georgenia sp. AZ-5 TaxID=3367526 RepID=UPI00375536FE